SRTVLRTAADRLPPPVLRPRPHRRVVDGVHTWIYPPSLPGHHAAPGTSPLLVLVHGGPTAAHPPVFSAEIAFHTSRGYTVVAVDHRGSSAHGRGYRDALRGRGGDLDQQNVLTVTRALQADGTGGAAVVTGGSAGDFTALGCVTRPGHPFAGAVSRYGVTDPEALAATAHDFESRYLDVLLGHDRAVWRERAPVHRLSNR